MSVYVREGAKQKRKWWQWQQVRSNPLMAFESPTEDERAKGLLCRIAETNLLMYWLNLKLVVL